MHAQRIGIDGFDPVNGRIVWLHPGMDIWVEDALDIPLGGLRIEVRAIVEFYPLGEVEDPRPAPILDVPRGGQLGDHLPLGRWAHGEEGVKDVVPDPEGEIAGGRSLVGIEKSHIAGHGEAQRATGLGLLSPAWSRPACQDYAKDDKHKPASLHRNLLWSQPGLARGRPST